MDLNDLLMQGESQIEVSVMLPESVSAESERDDRSTEASKSTEKFRKFDKSNRFIGLQKSHYKITKLPISYIITPIFFLIAYLSPASKYFNTNLIAEAAELSSNNFRSQPSQLFLPPSNQNIHSISLVDGFNKKKSEEEEEGFIMQSAPSVAPAVTNRESITVTTEEPTTISTSTDQPDQNDQRIPIDINRQQFLTHDQLLNASTKDENIHFNNEEVSVQKFQSSRAGMSKVSHVSSFLTDLFAYATNRQEEPNTTKEPQKYPEQQHPQLQTPTTCPGICRSILTASILCRNEINAPCPSFLQKCCDKDDVAFNGTPVETSAPMPSTDVDTISAPLSDNLSQSQEQTALNYQANLLSTSQATDQIGTTKSPTNATGEGIQSPNGAADLLADANRSASIYFLSSGSGTQESVGNRKQQEHPSQQQQQVDLAQSTLDENVPRFKNPTSQSFDSPLSEKASLQPLPSTTTIAEQSSSTTSKPLQVVVLQTANGTILHQPLNRTRPTYANWTDYHLSMMQNRPTSTQSVVYHSNIDPVKSFNTVAQKYDLNGTTIRRTLVVPDASSDKVINDQHSGGLTKSRTTRPPQTTTNTAALITTPTTSTTTTTTITSSTQQQQGTKESQLPVESVGNVLVDLLDTWINGATSSHTETTNDESSTTSADSLGETHVTEQAPSIIANEQQNDRRLGYELSFRQTVGEAGELMTNNGSNEQVQSIAQFSRCTGYCTLPLFTVLCDSTYRSADCGTSQKCCVIGKQTIGNVANHDEKIVSNNEQQETATCRGSCLPVYHSSLCTKPNELQIDSLSCLPNYVCCNQPEGSNQIGDELESLVNAADSSQTHMIDNTSPNGNNERQAMKDNSFLAALLPPLPPPIQTSSIDPIQPMIQETNFNKQPTTSRPSVAKTTQSSGIMSQLYQMLKSTASGKQRQKPQGQNQNQQQYQQPNANNFMYNNNQDPFLQFQAASALGSTVATPQVMSITPHQTINQQVMFPQQLMRFPQPPQLHYPQQSQHYAKNPFQQQHQLSHILPVNFNENSQMLSSMANAEQNPTPMGFNNPTNFNQQQKTQPLQPQSNPNSVRQIINPEQRQPMQQGSISFPPNNSPERQWHQNSRDNAHNAALNQQRQFPLFTGQSLAFGVGDANGGQQQQVARPVAINIQQPVKSQQQQQFIGHVSNVFPENSDLISSRPLPQLTTPSGPRQNPVNRPPPAIVTTSTISPDIRLLPSELTQPVVRVQQYSSGKVEPQQRQQVAQKVNDPGIRRNNVSSSSNNWLFSRVSNASENTMELSSSLAPPYPASSPNLNILISNGPFIDLQRVDNGIKRQQALQQSAPTTRPSNEFGVSPMMTSEQPQPVGDVDSNKLDQDQNVEESLAVNSGDLQQDSSAPEEQSSPTVSNGKNKVHATACGLSGPMRRRVSGNAKGRVMGGFDAKPDYWCWQAALMNNKNEYLCGGALIGAKWVLTAAHCVTQHLRSESQLYVRLGQHNLNATQAGASKYTKTILVKTSYVHHNHNGVTLDNDIALLRLEEPVDLEESSVCLVCLPERSSQIEPGKRCTVTGYGFESEAGPAALRVRQTELPIVGDQECQNKTSAVLGKPFALPASSFCAGGELGQDACHGDGGSPLSCLVDGYYELTGIVSWGYKCGSKDLPGLYSKVSAFVGWINQIVSVNN